MKKIFFVLILIFSAQTFAAEFSLTGKVMGVIASEGEDPPYVGIEVQGLPASTCFPNGKARVAISPTNPVYGAAVSLATTAVVSGNDVIIGYVDTCTVRSHSWDFDYIFLKD